MIFDGSESVGTARFQFLSILCKFIRFHHHFKFYALIHADPGGAGFWLAFGFHVFLLLTITHATLTEVFLFSSSCDTNDVEEERANILRVGTF